MRQLFRLLVLAVVALSGAWLQAESFRFRYEEGDKYHLVTEVQENVYINGYLSHSAEFLNKISMEVVETRGGSGKLQGTFLVSERTETGGELFRLEDEQYDSEFWRDERGRFRIDPRYLMPIIRDIPVFPEGSVAPGAGWQSEGVEVHDFSESFGISEPVRVPAQVAYTYVGDTLFEGKELALFEINYHAFVDLGGRFRSGGAPLRVLTTANQLLRFDRRVGQVHSYEDEFYSVYLFEGGQFAEFEGTSQGRLISAETMNRDQVKEEIERSIQEEGIEDATVEADEEGVTITLQNIQFPPDSAVLLPFEQRKLDKIGQILERYPDRDILIVGHTALAGTPQGRQQLSEQRAAAVGNYLLSRGVRDRSQMFYKGVGATQPIADNLSPEGMRMNRRVEIKLLEN